MLKFYSWKYKVLLFFILILGLPAAQESKAQNNKGVGIGLLGGYQKAADADEGSVIFGGLLRAKFTGSFAAEVSVNYRSEEYDGGNITVRSWPVLVSGLFYPIQNVYGLAGFGWYHTTFDFDEGFQAGDLDDKTQTKFGFHLGGGTEIPLSDYVALTADIKYIFLNYDWEDLSDTPISEFKNDFYIVNVGIIVGL